MKYGRGSIMTGEQMSTPKRQISEDDAALSHAEAKISIK